MTIRIGSNIQAIAGVRQLNQTSKSLNDVYQRLSSGQRINKASDDSAGLAIADAFRADQRVASVAIRNINDAISAVNITTSAINQQKNVLFRLGELAEQSANGVYSAEQRNALNNEYQALIKEFDRIAVTTEFNGEKLLNDNKELSFQVGDDSSADSRISLTTESSRALAGVVGVKSNFNEDLNINLGDLGPINTLLSLDNQSISIGFKHAEILVTLEDSQGIERDFQVYGFSLLNNNGLSYPSTLNTNTIDITVFNEYGTDSVSFSFDYKNNIFSTSLVIDETGATAEINLDFRQTQFENLDFFQEVRKSSIAFTNVSTATNSLDALDTVNNRIEDLSALEGKFGAVSQRLLIASENMAVKRENIANAESQIRDADVASESSKLIRNNILQQAGAAVLAQANQQPALALSLLN